MTSIFNHQFTEQYIVIGRWIKFTFDEIEYSQSIPNICKRFMNEKINIKL